MSGRLSGGARGNGGNGGTVSIRQESQRAGAFVYQSVPKSLGADPFKARLRDMATYLRDFAVTIGEKRICDEVRRGRSLSIEGLRALCQLAARSRRPFIVEETMRGAVLDAVLSPPVLCPVDSFLSETRRQSEADVTQALFLVERTDVRRDQALDALGQHHYALRVAMDSLHVWPRRPSSVTTKAARRDVAAGAR